MLFVLLRGKLSVEDEEPERYSPANHHAVWPGW